MVTVKGRVTILGMVTFLGMASIPVMWTVIQMMRAPAESLYGLRYLMFINKIWDIQAERYSHEQTRRN